MSGTTSGTGATPPPTTPPPATAATAATATASSTTAETTGTDTAAIPAGTGPETGTTPAAPGTTGTGTDGTGTIGAGDTETDTTAAVPTTAGTDDGAATPTPTAGADGTGATGTPTGPPTGTTGTTDADTGTGAAAGTPATAGGATSAQVPADPFEAQVARLYDTLFDRAPDSEGLAFWASALRGGTALGAVADGFVASPEAQGRSGGLGDAEFVNALYRNALDREADAAGRDFWTGALQRGSDRGDIVQAISEAPEHVSKPTLTFGGNDPLV
jgi:hypothetical protein